jgi:hypothetical protein
MGVRNCEIWLLNVISSSTGEYSVALAIWKSRKMLDVCARGQQLENWPHQLVDCTCL